ncbi:PfkB family carbohydrate kinase [Alphaproteobacteria bacterium]|nr:PfkB family carbohydrate kinase [Alphaproteobacteria bacterium]
MISNKKKYNTVFLSGNFNVLHSGHLRLFNEAKKIGKRLIIGVYGDKFQENKNAIKQNLRLNNLKHISIVDETFIIKESIEKTLLKLKPDVVIKGKEHENKYNPELKILNKYKGQMFFTSGESILSSQDFINKNSEVKKNNILKPTNFINRHNIKSENLIKILKNFKKLNIIVLGDLIIDEYIYCLPIGMSQEDPSIVLKPARREKYLGGAGIVASHAANLGAKVDFITVVGNDNHNDFIKKKLKNPNLKFKAYIDNQRINILKQRFKSKNKTLFKVSDFNQNSISLTFQKKIISNIKSKIKKTNLIILSDFNYGCLPTALIDKIIKIATDNNVFICADSQTSSQLGYISKYKNINLITPTEYEARVSVRNQEDGIPILCNALQKETKSKHIIMKLGPDGIFIHSNKTSKITDDTIKALNLNPVDIAGAGDSLLAISAMSLALGSSIWEASYLGSLGAAVQVSREGNVPIATKEIQFLI